MAKSPAKNPPAAKVKVEETEATVPTLEVETKENSMSSSASDAEPTLNPPISNLESSEHAFGAGAWNNDKRINGLYSTNHQRNSWMSIVGTGWVKLASNNDSGNEALNILATAAKVKNSAIQYYLDGGEVTQIYIW